MVMSICSYNLTIHYIPNIVYAVFHYNIGVTHYTVKIIS